MFYQEVEFKKRQPKMCATAYFYKVYASGFLYGLYHGYSGHMIHHLQEHPDHELIWLEPECEYDAKTYYKRISQNNSKTPT